ncbi:MAG: class I SAM-dependent methyltransferase [Chloroflexi bacterium]|nr:class I SAM-dependent methyltransferase [Chloroflexota bacterium]
MSKDWRNFYTVEAKGYDAQRYQSWYGALFKQLYHTALRTVLDDCAPEALILDVASGTGHNLTTLADYGRLAIASDLTLAMLQESRKQHQQTNLTYTLGSALELPFPDNLFDVVASARFLHLFPKSEQQAIIKEMTRILKPGGLLIVDFYNHYQWLFLSPFIGIYRAIKRKRPTEDTRNTISNVHRWMGQQNLAVRQTIGVSSYLLILARFLPVATALKLGRIFQTRPLRFLSEQFIISAKKQP